jgi:hypothetical protein
LSQAPVLLVGVAANLFIKLSMAEALTSLAVEFHLSVYSGAFDDEFKKRRVAR